MANEAIRVKALEWMEDEPAHDQIDERVFVTVGGLGRYSVHVRRNGFIHSFTGDEMVGLGRFWTIDRAKAACQADFARRVGECVEVDDVGNADALQARCAKLLKVAEAAQALQVINTVIESRLSDELEDIERDVNAQEDAENALHKALEELNDG